MSLNSIETINTNKDNFKFLNIYPLKRATVIIGVKFGGCGINLEKTRIKINRIG